MMESIIIVFCLLLYLAWKKYHTKDMIEEIRNNDIGKNGSNIGPAIYAAIAIVVLIGGIEIWGSFAEIYIAIPIAISGLYILRYRDRVILNCYMLLKGIYYLCSAIYSIWQYYSESSKLSELAIGFTIALAIFECVIALKEAIENLLWKKNADSSEKSSVTLFHRK